MKNFEKQMENEKKKEYLRSYRKSLRRENEILEEIQKLRADKMFPSVSYDGMPSGSSHSDLSDYAVLIDEQIELLKKERLERAKKRKGIEERIRAIHDDDEQSVLRMRYIMGMKWEEVADEIGYTYRRVTQIHGNALEHFIL